MKQAPKEKGPRKETELLVFVKAKKLAEYVMEASSKAPVKYMHSAMNHLMTVFFDIASCFQSFKPCPVIMQWLFSRE